MTCHLFNTKVAEKHGVEIAILIHNLVFWTDKNIANKRHLIDGKYWVYNSATAFAELFPYWNPKKIWRLLQKMEQDGLVISANHNQKQYDRTKWYAIIDQWIFQIYEIHLPNVENASAESGTPIPISNPDVVSDVIVAPTKDEREKEFRKDVYDKNSELLSDQHSDKILKEFSDYWTESKPKGRKLRFEMQTVFDIKRRLATWARNDFNGNNKKDTGKSGDYDKKL